MFAPDQQATADELVRVCRPGGTIAMANWTPGGGAGRFFGVMAPYVPPPPPGPAPTDWGDPDHVAALFGTRVADLVTEPAVVEVDFDGGPDELAELYLSSFPPVVATLAGLERRAAGCIGPRPDDVLPRRVRRRRRGPLRLPAGPGDGRLTRRQVQPPVLADQVLAERVVRLAASTSSKPAAS